MQIPSGNGVLEKSEILAVGHFFEGIQQIMSGSKYALAQTYIERITARGISRFRPCGHHALLKAQQEAQARILKALRPLRVLPDDLPKWVTPTAYSTARCHVDAEYWLWLSLCPSQHQL